MICIKALQHFTAKGNQETLPSCKDDDDCATSERWNVVQYMDFPNHCDTILNCTELVTGDDVSLQRTQLAFRVLGADMRLKRNYTVCPAFICENNITKVTRPVQLSSSGVSLGRRATTASAWGRPEAEN